MPYIKSDDGRREALQKGEPALNAGELNYKLYFYIKYNFVGFLTGDNIRTIFIMIRQFLGDKPNYQRYNDMTGALIRCAKEIKRRLKIDICEEFYSIMESFDQEIADYEDVKIQENGDVE